MRGFTEREIAGDSGAFASVEVQTPNWCAATAVTALQCRALAFADGATVSRNNVQPGEDERTTISSLGLGLRYGKGPLILSLDYGRLVLGSKVPQAANSAAPEKGDDKLYFNLALRF